MSAKNLGRSPMFASKTSSAESEARNRSASHTASHQACRNAKARERAGMFRDALLPHGEVPMKTSSHPSAMNREAWMSSPFIRQLLPHLFGNDRSRRLT